MEQTLHNGFAGQDRQPKLNSEPSGTLATGRMTILGPLTIQSLALVRTAIGATLIAAPSPLLSLFFLMGTATTDPAKDAGHLSPAEKATVQPSALLPRLLGVREIVIGVLLWTAFRRYVQQRRQGLAQATEGRRGFRSVLWANIAVDLMDALCCAAIVVADLQERKAAAWFGAGAMVFVALGALGLSRDGL
ncbi:hypothetical protein O9K51_04714 [Purpureocillium lavendulum]|uniref:Uncharacterized protein n=1 Tax=Purpureocillium lavendulum TaxID=1247861 RepID=A0AB34FZT3_9HYPO|nr:hypothetical protein O9K51_04714 [Purpureocillium lavendulum]